MNNATTDIAYRQEPLQGPSVWSASELLADPHWRIELSNAEVEELVRATRNCDGHPLESITGEAFPVDALRTTLARVRRGLLEGRGLALLRGLPVGQFDEAGVARMLWGIGQHLGVPQPQDAAGALLHHVRDTGVNVAGQDNVRTFQTKEAQPWHNDGGDIFLLLCRETARSGGKSYVASAHYLFNRLLERDPELVRTLQDGFFFDARGQQLPGQGPVQHVPIFIWHAARMFILHKRHYIELAQRFPDVPRLSDRQREAIDALEDICNDPAVHVAFDLEPGDLEIANNFAVLHKRGEFDQQDDAISQRHMLRLWLGLPDGWPLPEAFRATREYGPLFSIRAG